MTKLKTDELKRFFMLGEWNRLKIAGFRNFNFQLIIAIIGIFIAAISLMFNYTNRLSTKREIKCELLSLEELTSNSRVPGLSSSYTFYGNTVAHLWQVVMRVYNSGGVQIIGTGPQSMFIRNAGIVLHYPPEVSILKIELDSALTTCTDVASAFNVNCVDSCTAIVTFSQLMTNDGIGIRLIASADSEIVRKDFVHIDTRDLAAGSIVLTSKLSDYSVVLPAGTVAMVEFAMCILFTAIAGALLKLLWKSYQWRRDNGAALFEYLRTVPSLTPETFRNYLARPSSIPWNIARGFDRELMPASLLQSRWDFVSGVIAAMIFVPIAIYLIIAVFFIGHYYR